QKCNIYPYTTMFRSGMTENEIKGIALKAIYEKGGESEGYPFWILTGKGSNKPVGKIRNKKIKEGDIVHIQLGARYEGYVASLGRSEEHTSELQSRFD